MEEKETEIKKSVWERKIGSVKLALFKNKNVKGVKYIMWSVCIYRFPFKFTKRIALTDTEAQHLTNLLNERPEVKVENKPYKKIKIKEE